MKFEWDKNKAKVNLQKHKISFSEASTIFGDPLELTIADPEHSIGEFRFISIGKSQLGSLLVVSYIEEEPNIIRIISARKAERPEMKFYEQKS